MRFHKSTVMLQFPVKINVLLTKKVIFKINFIDFPKVVRLLPEALREYASSLKIFWKTSGTSAAWI